MSKAAAGTGTIRKKTVTRNGKQYEYWEARVTVGRDPGTGKQVQRSFTGKTQREVAQKMKEATAALDAGTYTAPCKLTVGQWLDVWLKDYQGHVKPSTKGTYTGNVARYIKPALGAVKLTALTGPAIQSFYNSLQVEREGKPGLSAGSVHNIHVTLHRALQQAVKVGYLRFNPSEVCTLPRREKKEIHPLDEEESRAFLEAIKGHPFEVLYTVALFTGMRESELLGLRWVSVDFKQGSIRIDKQLMKVPGDHILTTPKSNKSRTVVPAPWIMDLLKHHRAVQAQQRLKVGELWEDSGLVFTNELGRCLTQDEVYYYFKPVVASIGRPDARFHDLRHTYAVAAIRAGDDIKTVQGNLGHATAAFTLDVYGHVTDEMKKDSGQRMDAYIKKIMGD